MQFQGALVFSLLQMWFKVVKCGRSSIYLNLDLEKSISNDPFNRHIFL